MSFAVFDFLKKYAEWREGFLSRDPERRLFPWLGGLVPEIPELEDPIISLGPKGEELKKKGIGAILAVGIVLLLLSSSDKL
ncbi:unnamed protein product [marine sediment metagenome]|uniref:Uncharacterized protein n=1 Tax=marine sediment metagenome TaxID=412755 RepID=X1BN33_9ZZZZ